MATEGAEVGRNLLKYRFDQLDPAMETAQQPGVTNVPALYPMGPTN